jgi:hypothetical protein
MTIFLIIVIVVIISYLIGNYLVGESISFNGDPVERIINTLWGFLFLTGISCLILILYFGLMNFSKDFEYFF